MLTSPALEQPLILASWRHRITTTPSIMMNMMTIMIAIYFYFFSIYAIDICMLIAMYNSLYMYPCMNIIINSEYVCAGRQWAERLNVRTFHSVYFNVVWALLVSLKIIWAPARDKKKGRWQNIITCFSLTAHCCAFLFKIHQAKTDMENKKHIVAYIYSHIAPYSIYKMIHTPYCIILLTIYSIWYLIPIIILRRPYKVI